MLNPFTGKEMRLVTCETCGGNGQVRDATEIGDTAYAYRMSKGKTQAAVAAKMGFSPMYISDLERGRRAWNQRLLTAYKEACDADA